MNHVQQRRRPTRLVYHAILQTLKGARHIVWVSVAVLSCACSNGKRAPLIDSIGTNSDQNGTLVCHAGVPGCSCENAGEQYRCGSVKQKDGDFVTCSEGLSTCVDGVWGPCVGDNVVQRSVQSLTLKSGSGTRLMSVTTSCNNACDPYCGQVDADNSDARDAGGIAQLADGGLTLISGPGTGTGTACTGLQCKVSACGGNTKATKLTGRVYDPAGQVPLYDAYVYVPVDADLTKLTAISNAWADGVTCQRCSDATVHAVAVGQTNTNGEFTLEGLPSGTNIPLVVEMGKWRRIIVISTITACQSNAVTNNCTATDKSLCVARLPRNRFDGYNPANGGYAYVSASGANGKADMPMVAMISGSADPFQCMLLKAGIDPNEFGSYDKNPERRFHYYHSPDSPGAKLSSTYGNQINGAVLWNKIDNLNNYDVVIPACEGSAIDKIQSVVPPPSGVNPYRNLINYANAGGRVFTTHYGYVWLQYPYVKSGYSDWRNAATWTHQTGTTSTQDPLTASLNTSFPKGSSLSDWLLKVSASTTAGSLILHEGRQDLSTIGTSSQSWMTAVNTSSGSSSFVPLFTFNTPLGAAESDQCGRLVFSDFHVSANALVNTSSTSCYSADDCGFTANCTGGTAPTTGTCSEPCGSDSDCSVGYTCGGTHVAGTCTPLTCTSSCSAGGTCSGGQCKCTNSDQCGSDSCALAPGSCTTSTCLQDSGCGLSQSCSGASAGSCKVDSCTKGSNCASGKCSSGKCACTSRTQCSSNSCTATPATCGTSSCTSDDTSCGSSESCSLGTSGVCVADSCGSSSSCSTGSCWGSNCQCTKASDCGTGRTCSWGVCASKSCTSDSGCQGWEHCRLNGACNPAPCTAGTCAGGTCEADGKCHCQSGSQCDSGTCTVNSGTCSGTAASCTQESACGSIESCTGVTQGNCVGATCSASKPCAAGVCVSGTCKCTSAGDCGSNACSSVGSCGTAACFTNADCGVTEQCTGATLGTCTKSCGVDVDCPNGEKCISGKCSGCTSSTQCQTANYPTACVGSSGGVKGTCSLNSSTTFPQACKRGNLTAQEKALEFMFFDLTACVTPDAYEPPGLTSLFNAATFSPPDYVATCDIGSSPVWREVRWSAKIPTTASITFAASSGADASSLLPATPLTIVTTTKSTAASSTDVAYIDTGSSGTGAFNLADPTIASDHILRLTITLTPTTDQLSAPTLLDWSIAYSCVPNK
jgi:hypothetical protein